ncbi:MAG: permease, partial [Steroidobacteraceae bacterium]
MLNTAYVLLAVIAALAIVFTWRWFRAASAQRSGAPSPGLLRLGIGFVTNFFDTLGIGSFAPTTALYKFRRVIPD